MAVDVRPGEVRPSTRPADAGVAPVATVDRVTDVVRVAIVVVGLGVFAVVVRDGSPIWQTVRGLVTVAVTAGVVLAVTGRDRTRRGPVALAVGLFGTAVGVGIGLPHLTKAGFTLTTVAGLLTLLGGLVLFVIGFGTLVRIARWWSAVIAPVLLTALALTVLVFGQAIAATNVPSTSIGSRTPADVGLAYEDVELRTTDGVTLSAWYVPSGNGAAVVLLHGSGSTRANLIDRAEVLARHDYGLLLLDARGHGRSGGRAMDFGWYGNEDVAAAVSFLQDRPDVDDDRIAALGTSMGGEEAIGAAAADDRIKAVVAEGATNRMPGDKTWLADAYGWRGRVQQGLEWVIYTTADLLTEADPPIALRDAVTAAAPRPVLLIAGGARPDEGRAGRHIQQGAPDSVELWVVPGSGHTQAPDTHPDEWEERVARFLDEALDLRSPS